MTYMEIWVMCWAQLKMSGPVMDFYNFLGKKRDLLPIPIPWIFKPSSFAFSKIIIFCDLSITFDALGVVSAVLGDWEHILPYHQKSLYNSTFYKMRNCHHKCVCIYIYMHVFTNIFIFLYIDRCCLLSIGHVRNYKLN